MNHMLQCYSQLQPDFYIAIIEAMDKDKNRLQDNQVCGKGHPPAHPPALV